MSLCRSLIARAILPALISIGAGVTVAAAQGTVPAPGYEIHHDLVRGRVTGDSGRAVANADVAVTMAPDRLSLFARTDADGRYEVVFEKGTGDYLVHVSAVGWQAFRKRVTRTGHDSVFVVDAPLKAAVQQLAAVQVQARRQRPAREPSTRGAGIGAAETTPSGVDAAIPADQRGNLEAIAATLPGVTTVPGGGVSVMGLPPAQNSTTLNGLEFGGGGIPRGAQTSTRVSTSTYDPARGGFSGAQTQVTLAPGDQTVSRYAYVTLDAPQLQAADAVARRAGMPYTAFDLNLGTSGGWKMDRWMYNTGVEYKRQFSDASSLLNADNDLLERSGVARDSVARLLASLAALGVPANVGGVPTSRVTDYASVMARFDRPLFDYSSYAPLNTTWGVIAYGNWTRRGAMSIAPTATPAHGGESRQINAGAQYLYSAYFGKLKDQLTELRSGLSVSQSNSDPYLRLPDGRVLVSSSFADGTGGIASLGFAGNSGLDASNRLVTWQTTSETQFYWRGLATHRGKLYADSRLAGVSQDVAANRLGSFSFNSLADLHASRPASYSRTLTSPTRTGGEWSGALAASDQWAATPRFTLLYGVRLEGNRYTSTPAYNPEIQTLFGARTDLAPDRWHVSPRIGFNWLSTSTSRPAANGMTANSLGAFYSMPRGVLRGGAGEFRQSLDPALLADASTSTGLPGGAQRISCVGPAAPIPDWSSYAGTESTIPSSCVAVAGVPGFADAAPSVLLFDRNYQPARAWRGNLSWGSVFHSITYTIDAAYSLNLDQPSSVDLNFAGTPRFVLPGEDGRAVFVPTSNIVAGTGAVATSAARQSASYGSVFSRMSDLHGWAQQATLRVRPLSTFIGSGKVYVDGAYTISKVRAQGRGFDGAAFGDPRRIEWARGDYTPTHELWMQAGYQARWFSTTLAGKLTSGLPYTPLIGSDVNGDGLANDRAFVYGTAAQDRTMAAAMQKLLASTSGNARDCLARQVGSVAGRNSCEGPWLATLNAAIAPSYRLLHALHMTRGSSVTLNLSNPLGGLDQLLHGNNLRGWGTPSYPDRVLYFVRGFDSVSHAFRYEVNPRFGDTRPSATSLRTPFRVTLDVTLNFSRDGEAQQIDRILNPGRQGNAGAKLDSAAIIKRYCGNLPDWYSGIIQETDSLLLTRDQVEALRTAKAEYTKRILGHWGAWSGELARVPDRFDAMDIAKRQTKMIDDAWELARQEAQATLPKILSPVQLKLLPGFAGTLYRAKEPITGTRYFSTLTC